MRRWVLAGLAVVGVVVAIIAATTLVGRSGDRAAAAPPLSVTVEQYRTDEVARTVKLAVRNTGDTTIEVVDAELVAPSFTPAGQVTTTALVPPGGLRVDIRSGYGRGRCTGPPDQLVSEPASVRLGVRQPNQDIARVTLPLPYPNELLNRLLRLDCQQEALLRIVTVAFGPLRPTADGALAGTLVLTRQSGAEPVTVHDVDGSVLISVDPEPADRPPPLGTLAGGAARLEMPVRVDAERCDGHALGEIKKPYVFPVWLRIGATEQNTDVAVTEADKVTLFEMVRQRCHLAK